MDAEESAELLCTVLKAGGNSIDTALEGLDCYLSVSTLLLHQPDAQDNGHRDREDQRKGQQHCVEMPQGEPGYAQDRREGCTGHYCRRRGTAPSATPGDQNNPGDQIPYRSGESNENQGAGCRLPLPHGEPDKGKGRGQQNAAVNDRYDPGGNPIPGGFRQRRTWRDPRAGRRVILRCVLVQINPLQVRLVGAPDSARKRSGHYGTNNSGKGQRTYRRSSRPCSVTAPG